MSRGCFSLYESSLTNRMHGRQKSARQLVQVLRGRSLWSNISAHERHTSPELIVPCCTLLAVLSSVTLLVSDSSSARSESTLDSAGPRSDKPALPTHRPPYRRAPRRWSGCLPPPKFAPPR